MAWFLPLIIRKRYFTKTYTMFKASILICFTLLLMNSCTIEQNYYIKKDQSGHFELKMNVTDMLSSISDSVKKVKDVSPIKEYLVEDLMVSVEEYDGVSNFGYLHNGEDYRFSFDFNNVKEVGEFLGVDSLTSELFNIIHYERVGKKKLLIDISTLSDLSDNPFYALNELKSMSSLIDININFYFEEEIKTLVSDLAIYDEFNNVLVYNFPLSDLMNNQLIGSSSVKFR